MSRFDLATKWAIGFWMLCGVGPLFVRLPWGEWIAKDAAPAWVQAVGSVLAILAMVWQRWHEVSVARSSKLAAQLDAQNGARRLVAAVRLIVQALCDPGRAEVMSRCGPNWGVVVSQLESLQSALNRVDSHGLPSWRHTEAVVVTLAAVNSMLRELNAIRGRSPGGIEVKENELLRMSWLQSFAALVESAAPEMDKRLAEMSKGLPIELDPA